MKYTTESFKEEFGVSAEDVIGTLSGLKEKRLRDCFGICHNLSELVIKINNDKRRKGYEIIEELSLGWEYHTGDRHYPVRSKKGCYLWKASQLELRIDLINYIIKQLEEITNE